MRRWIVDPWFTRLDFEAISEYQTSNDNTKNAKLLHFQFNFVGLSTNGTTSTALFVLVVVIKK